MKSEYLSFKSSSDISVFSFNNNNVNEEEVIKKVDAAVSIIVKLIIESIFILRILFASLIKFDTAPPPMSTIANAENIIIVSSDIVACIL